MADKVLEEVTKVDRSSMTHVATEEKNVLPDAEGIFFANIYFFCQIATINFKSVFTENYITKTLEKNKFSRFFRQIAMINFKIECFEIFFDFCAISQFLFTSRSLTI